MRFILYFFFFYITFQLIRRLLFGPRPARRVYVNWGAGRTGDNPFGFNTQRRPEDDRNSTEPRVGQFRTNKSTPSEPKRLNNVEDADFEEIKS